MNELKIALVFDVDGVLTNPQTKMADLGLLSKISNFIEAGIPVAFNTGRSYAWLEREVLSRILKEVFISCEKGAIWGVYDGKSLKKSIDPSISVPEELKEFVRLLITNKYEDCVFYDEEKTAMITAEMRIDFPLEDFPVKQKELIKDMNDLVESLGLQSKLRVIETTIVVEIEDLRVGKDLGAKRILGLLEEGEIKPQEFITIGDGRSDILMAEEFAKNGYKTEFVYVGAGQIEGKYNFPVISTQGKFTEGTLEFLEKLDI